jgi:hypothetical protein
MNGADLALADRIASRGREALVERLRRAYAEAAASNADIVSLEEARIEALVQAAADRADGLQWRRALAQVATEELGVSLAQALTHPAVREAQERLGAPSYEAGLAELVARPVPPPAPAEQLDMLNPDDTYVESPPEPEPVQPEMVIDEPEEHGSTGELEAVEADDEIFELLPPPEPVEYETAAYQTIPDQVDEQELESVPEEVPDEPAAEEPTAAPAAEEPPADPVAEEPPAEPAADEPTGAPAAEEPPAEPTAVAIPAPQDDENLQVLAYHLGGVANLPTGRDGLDLRLSEHGLDIYQREGEIIGRLHWDEIDALEVVAVRGRLRRQPRTLSRIVVRTKHGDASFEIPGLSSEDLEARVEPLVSRYGSA